MLSPSLAYPARRSLLTISTPISEPVRTIPRPSGPYKRLPSATVDATKPPPVKFQEIVRDGQATIVRRDALLPRPSLTTTQVGRVKIPTVRDLSSSTFPCYIALTPLCSLEVATRSSCAD